jgi:hypothetical protein
VVELAQVMPAHRDPSDVPVRKNGLTDICVVNRSCVARDTEVGVEISVEIIGVVLLVRAFKPFGRLFSCADGDGLIVCVGLMFVEEGKQAPSATTTFGHSQTWLYAAQQSPKSQAAEDTPGRRTGDLQAAGRDHLASEERTAAVVPCFRSVN